MAKENVVVAVAGVITHNDIENKILALREKKSNPGIGKKAGMLAIPMGHIG